MSQHPQGSRPDGGWEYWTTVTYRSVILIIIAVLIMVLAVWALFWRESFDNVLAKLTSGGGENNSVEEAPHARFVNLDGTVRVKKRDSVQWVSADYSTPLLAGDTVQTGTNGIARITFVDGTTYVVKPDTLIVIERHETDENRATRVAVQITSGAVDLSTGSWEAAGSSSEVRFENAVAHMEENTRAAIRQDPEGQVHEITVSEGRAAVEKGEETIEVGPYERVGFSDPNDPLSKQKVVAPPKLLRPRNLEPIISTDARREVVSFEWERVQQARSYRLELSTSPLFTSYVLDRRVKGTNFRWQGLNRGEYYWRVSSIDAHDEVSPPSERNTFTLAEQAAAEQLLLEIEDMIQHGRVIEIVGRTEPGATVTINAEPVAYVGPDGRFKHFTQPLRNAGAHRITIVAQNARGEVVTRTKTVYVQ
ncbi:MAG: FecR domain-containing protein [Terriglobia bacterium]